MNNQNQFSALDILNIISLMIGLENLQENRDQSAQNDVHIANQEQAEFLLGELSKQFDEIKTLLSKVLQEVSK